MPQRRYKESLWLEAKRLFVEQEMPSSSISKHYNGRPTKAAIDLRAKKIDPRTQKNWYDERRELIELKMVQMSPQAMRNKIFAKLWNVVNDDEVTGSKFADSLSKIQKSISEMMHPSNQVPVMFWVLEDYVRFCQKKYPSVVTEDLVQSLRDYKDHLRAEKLGI
jgi:hypothetical protein